LLAAVISAIKARVTTTAAEKYFILESCFVVAVIGGVGTAVEARSKILVYRNQRVGGTGKIGFDRYLLRVKENKAYCGFISWIRERGPESITNCIHLPHD
jgi:hypothetical protein